jgi:uncharacterized protein YndB with AHSA1/START domain
MPSLTRSERAVVRAPGPVGVARVPASHVIDYRDVFQLAVPPAQLWAAIERVDRFEDWWGWLREVRLEGAGLCPGSVLSGVVSPPLPYRMHVRVVLEECVPPQVIGGAVHGDLEGEARLTFVPDGEGTRASVAWTIEMTQPTMRLAARVAAPLLRWGHDRVVESTVTEFERHLDPGG